MIFRRENRGESFQRQISNLRQQQQDEPQSEDEEQQHSQDSHDYNYDYPAEEPTSDTNRFATEQGTPSEGISFPSSRAESYEPSPEETTISSPPPPAAPQQGYDETRQWQAAAAPSPSPTPAMPTSDSSTSTIAKNAYWNGTLKSEGSLQVHGKADGELHSATDLYVAEGAEVDASLHADSVVVAGLVRGKIEARSRLEVLPQGEVTGDVRSPKLIVHEGATISGQLKMEEVGSGASSGASSTPSAGGGKS